MAEHEYYTTLSNRFEELAAQAIDPVLANAYRALAERYRALDFWHRKFANRYETSNSTHHDDEIT